MEKRIYDQNYDVSKSILGQRIKRAREYREILITELADMLDIDYPSLYRYENGIVKPNKLMIQKIAKTLDINIDWLVSNDSENIYSIFEMDPHCDPEQIIENAIAKFKETEDKETKYFVGRRMIIESLKHNKIELSDKQFLEIKKIIFEEIDNYSKQKFLSEYSELIDKLDTKSFSDIMKVLVKE